MPDDTAGESILVTDTPVITPDRILTSDEADAYAARLDAVGFAFSVAGANEAYGFDLTDGTHTYNYRYDGSASTAVELMDRICLELGA